MAERVRTFEPGEPGELRAQLVAEGVIVPEGAARPAPASRFVQKLDRFALRETAWRIATSSRERARELIADETAPVDLREALVAAIRRSDERARAPRAGRRQR